MSQNQKSLEEDHSCKPYDDEFHINLTLQKASSCSEEDSAVNVVSTGEVKLTADDTAQGTANPPASTAPNQQESPPPQTVHHQEEVQQEQQHEQQHQQQQEQQPHPHQPLQDTVDSLQEPAGQIPKQQVDFYH
jgi:hypothetical protein